MRRAGPFFVALFVLASSALPCAALASTKDLIRQAKAADEARYAFAVKEGAEINATEGSRSFFIYWAPKKTKLRGVIVTLHGHGSWAFDEFYLWKDRAEKNGLAILALQWWLGQGETTEDYLTPQEMYAEIDRILRRKQIRPGKAILHGFSRGSANSYAVAALDAHSGNHFFKGVISNAGGASLDYFPNRQIDLGMMGSRVFEGTDWVLYCGGQDPEPERDGCPAMNRTKGWIQKHGGRVVLFLKDLTAGHGGFHRNPRRIDEALSKFVI